MLHYPANVLIDSHLLKQLSSPQQQNVLITKLYINTEMKFEIVYMKNIWFIQDIIVVCY